MYEMDRDREPPVDHMDQFPESRGLYHQVKDEAFSKRDPKGQVFSREALEAMGRGIDEHGTDAEKEAWEHFRLIKSKESTAKQLATALGKSSAGVISGPVSKMKRRVELAKKAAQFHGVPLDPYGMGADGAVGGIRLVPAWLAEVARLHGCGDYEAMARALVQVPEAHKVHPEYQNALVASLIHGSDRQLENGRLDEALDTLNEAIETANEALVEALGHEVVAKLRNGRGEAEWRIGVHGNEPALLEAASKSFLAASMVDPHHPALPLNFLENEERLRRAEFVDLGMEYLREALTWVSKKWLPKAKGEERARAEAMLRRAMQRLERPVEGEDRYGWIRATREWSEAGGHDLEVRFEEWSPNATK